MGKEKNPSWEYIEYICNLYDDVYDDRIEDCRPPTAGDEHREPGEDWIPGKEANHKSLKVFSKELEALGIKLSTSKIRKVLITGGCWSTERSRQVAELFYSYTKPVSEDGGGMDASDAVKKIAKDLDVSTVTVSVNLPYQDVVYNLEDRSSNALRCARYKKRKKNSQSNR